MQQAVDPSEVDESTVLGQVLHHAAKDFSFLQLGQRLFLLLGVFDFQHGLAREHDVSATLVDLDHAHVELTTDEALQVAHGTHVHQRTREKRRKPDVHLETTLDPVDDASDDRLARVVGLFHHVPDFETFGFLLGEDDVTVAVLGPLEENIDLASDFDVGLATEAAELLYVDHSFRLVADVYDDFLFQDPEYRAGDDVAFLD